MRSRRTFVRVIVGAAVAAAVGGVYAVGVLGMSAPRYLAWLAVATVPVHWAGVYLLLRILLRSRVANLVLRDRLIAASGIATVVTIFGAVFVSNDQPRPWFTLFETQIATRGAIVSLVAAVLYWLSIYLAPLVDQDREATQDTADKAREAVRDAADAAREVRRDVADAARELDRADGVAEDTYREASRDVADAAREDRRDAADASRADIGPVTDSVRETARDVADAAREDRRDDADAFRVQGLRSGDPVRVEVVNIDPLNVDQVEKKKP